jgi:hypothetical protein
VCFSAEDFDPRYAVPSLENNASPSKWLAKKNNLAAVHKCLLRYIQSHCSGDIDPIALGIPDFNAIAEKEDEQETVKVGNGSKQRITNCHRLTSFIPPAHRDFSTGRYKQRQESRICCQNYAAARFS